MYNAVHKNDTKSINTYADTGKPQMKSQKLKIGTVSRDFAFWSFSQISLPPAPEYPIRNVSNLLENSRRFSQVKLHHRYQQHRWQIFPWCQ
jgi:hypothetical protein